MDTTLARVPVGQLLDGRYRVEAHLAHGGMATVYLGTDTRLDRTVALKIMHAELASDEEFVRRFVAEARSVARLSHPNVVAVYDQGADGRTLYLAMEYVPGRTLRDLLTERSALRPREALDILEGVLAGLAAAHAAGIAHRDVKPENVLLGDNHSIKVADFGLARLLSEATHTKSGLLIGTAAYLAPEQVAGGRTDFRADVYAAGIMLFELLTGRQPYTGDTPLTVAYRHVNEVVPAPSSLVPGLPPALDSLVALATSRDPELRPADAGQFLRAITGARHGLPLDVPPPALPGTSPGIPPGTAPSASNAETAPPRPVVAPAWPDPHAGAWPGAQPPAWPSAQPRRMARRPARRAVRRLAGAAAERQCAGPHPRHGPGARGAVLRRPGHRHRADRRAVPPGHQQDPDRLRGRRPVREHGTGQGVVAARAAVQPQARLPGRGARRGAGVRPARLVAVRGPVHDRAEGHRGFHGDGPGRPARRGPHPRPRPRPCWTTTSPRAWSSGPSRRTGPG